MKQTSEAAFRLIFQKSKPPPHANARPEVEAGAGRKQQIDISDSASISEVGPFTLLNAQ